MSRPGGPAGVSRRDNCAGLTRTSTTACSPASGDADGVRMTRDVVARAGARIDAWIGLYTHALPLDVVEDRRDEVLADIDDQAEWARSQNLPAAHIARSLLSRALRAHRPISLGRHPWRLRDASDRALVCVVAVLTLVLMAVGAVALHPPAAGFDCGRRAGRRVWHLAGGRRTRASRATQNSLARRVVGNCDCSSDAV